MCTYSRPTGHINLPQSHAARPRRRTGHGIVVPTRQQENIWLHLRDTCELVGRIKLVYECRILGSWIDLIQGRSVDGGAKEQAILTDGEVLDPRQVREGKDGAHGTIIS